MLRNFIDGFNNQNMNYDIHTYFYQKLHRYEFLSYKYYSCNYVI